MLDIAVKSAMEQVALVSLASAVDATKREEYIYPPVDVPDTATKVTIYQDQSAWPKAGDRVLKIRLDILEGKTWRQFFGCNCVATLPFDIDGNPMLVGESNVDLPTGKARQIRVRVIPFVDMVTAIKVAF